MCFPENNGLLKTEETLMKLSVLNRVAGLALAALMSLAGCGGGGTEPAATPTTDAREDAQHRIDDGGALSTVLHAVPTPPPAGGGGTDATTLTVHYQRPAGDYAGWQIHTFNAAVDPGWNNGHNIAANDSFGAIYEVPLKAGAGAGSTVGYLFHKFDDKDHGGADQSYVLKAGKNEIWRVQGDPVTYSANPAASAPADIAWVRVHYKRYGNDYANWGLHLWPTNGIDTARIPAGVTIDVWPQAVGFDRMPGYAAGQGEVVFDIPVLNPKDDANRKSLEFIIHGKSPNESDKDGRNDNIRVDYAALTVRNQVGEIWLVQQDATVYTSVPDTRSASTTDARAFWLNMQLIQWPRVDSSGVIKLYHSATGQILAPKDGKVSGADGAITLDAFSGNVPTAAAERFKWIGKGAVFAVRSSDFAQLPVLHKRQLVLVQENAAGLVQNATTAQNPGALDDLYAAAATVDDLGASVKRGRTQWKLWAPTAQRVLVYTYRRANGRPVSVDALEFDAASGVWSARVNGDHEGRYYRFAVEVFVRGVGVVRNLVTDPYSLSLSANSARSVIADLDSRETKPPGWDRSMPPATVAAAPDMSIYELHVRDFSANDASVRRAHRGKYLAFTDRRSNGMKHLKALADAGLTDVHLLPVFDIASVPEDDCTTPVIPTATPDAPDQQAAVAATAGGDCFNWGYDPFHFTAPDGAYASDADDGATRIREFRAMVKALHEAGLRVGMDVVYNHTTASGQNDKSVLDRIVPGYYHRYNTSGGIERSTCCDNTATENLMMGKLMIDSAIVWARDYKISSLRFDIMGHQPRAVMEQLQAQVNAAAGRPVQLLGEGWNFGEVANGARFVQATLYSLPGSGIGSFNPWVRDAVRGGGPFTSGTGLVSEQGWINGLWFDPNAQAPASVSKNDLMWRGDLIKAALAGSIKSFPLTTHWDATVTLDQLDASNGGAGYVLQPSEAVNYVENHDNQTLFDNNVFKLPLGTSAQDRARVQLLGAAVVALSQGTPYFHAGVDTLRSKSLDRNSYDAGDWFNRLDWSYQDNFFGSGLPRQSDNGDNWNVMRPFLQNAAAIKPAPADIAFMRDAFRDLLKIRASTTLLRLKTADEIKSRLMFHNTGSAQVPTVLVARIDGNGHAGANFKELVYLINADKTAQTVTVGALAGKAYALHPVHSAAGAADARAATATYTAATGAFSVPARTAVFVVN
jgi:pullulanase